MAAEVAQEEQNRGGGVVNLCHPMPTWGSSTSETPLSLNADCTSIASAWKSTKPLDGLAKRRLDF